MQDAGKFSWKEMRGRFERNPESTVINIDLPNLPSSPKRRYWRMKYGIEPMLSTFDALPTVVTHAMELASFAAHCAQSPAEIETTNPPAPCPSDPSPFALLPLDEPALLQDIDFGSLRMALPPPTGNDAADAARGWTALCMQEAADSRIVPLVPTDLLCLVLHDLLHARRPRAARYLRLWLGAGEGALVLWETDRTGAAVSFSQTFPHNIECLRRVEAENQPSILALLSLPPAQPLQAACPESRTRGRMTAGAGRARRRTRSGRWRRRSTTRRCGRPRSSARCCSTVTAAPAARWTPPPASCTFAPAPPAPRACKGCQAAPS
jgi:hypothetical protein